MGRKNKNHRFTRAPVGKIVATNAIRNGLPEEQGEDNLTEKDIRELMRHDSYTRNRRGAIVSRNGSGKVVK